MSWRPMHEIRVEHDWQETGRSKAELGTFSIFESCQSCGQKREALGLSTAGQSQMSEEENIPWLKRIASNATERLRVMEEQHHNLVQGTRYEDLPSMLEGIDMQYDHTFSSGRIPFYVLNWWTRFTGRKSKRRMLLLFRQGWVCNRCDRIFPLANDLTEDHILPRSKGGQSKLKNLQLLCRECNEKKGSDTPGAKDISPFSWQGPSCIHRITCIELAKLRRSCRL